MRRALDTAYDAAAWLAAGFMVGTLASVLLGIFGRLLDFYIRGTDAYAGYCMAAAGFLALAHTFRRGEHIRVTLLLEQAGAARPWLERLCLALALFASGLLAWYSVRLAWQSHTFNDISTGNDATRLWIPQIGMALGTGLLMIALLDAFVGAWRATSVLPSAPATPSHVE
ncbi:MAG: TRAP transporter small permease [Betaproteobacteria bacterium]